MAFVFDLITESEIAGAGYGLDPFEIFYLGTMEYNFGIVVL